MRSGDPADDLTGGRGLYCGESVETHQLPAMGMGPCSSPAAGAEGDVLRLAAALDRACYPYKMANSRARCTACARLRTSSLL
jgi:hypothetical protein